MAGNGAHIAGTASYRERMALPPGAVFEAVLEDVSLADAPAVELGRATTPEPGNPPFNFEIDYDPAAIRPEGTYSVRAQVSVGRKLLFVSDTMNPVLTHGASDKVSIWMIKVGDTAAPSPDKTPAIGAHGLRLPATFTGRVPCADCEAERFQLNLWPDQVFFLRRAWIGKDRRQDSIGRWSVDADRHVLDLRGTGAEFQFRILGPDRLQLLAPDEKRTEPDGDSVADRHRRVSALRPAPAAARHADLCRRRGPLHRMPDRAGLSAGQGRRLRGARARLPRRRRRGRGPDHGELRRGDRPRARGRRRDTGPQILVERFVGVWPGETCERAVDKASLTNTYWKILRLGETEVAPGEGRREPNLILRDGAPRFTATVGCNQFSGAYTLTADRLSFGPTATTRMACPAPLDDWEERLHGVLQRAATWRIDGQTLELLDAGGSPLALFQAVYLY